MQTIWSRSCSLIASQSFGRHSSKSYTWKYRFIIFGTRQDMFRASSFRSCRSEEKGKAKFVVSNFFLFRSWTLTPHIQLFHPKLAGKMFISAKATVGSRYISSKNYRAEHPRVARAIAGALLSVIERFSCPYKRFFSNN